MSNHTPYVLSLFVALCDMAVDLQQSNFHAIIWEIGTIAWTVVAWQKERRWRLRYGQSQSGIV